MECLRRFLTVELEDVIMKEFKNKRNPILPVEYHIPDSEAHVMPDGKLYLYGSFDNQESEFCSDKYHVVSTPDMENWTIHDVSLTGQQIPWFNDPDAPKYQGIDWTHPTPFIQKMIAGMMEAGDVDIEQYEQEKEEEKAPFLFAPDCIEKNGKYYLYFCMSDDSEGVAVSDKPEGPFTDPVQLPCGGIDPAIFIDDDGQAYYYWGQLFSHGVKMNADMISFDSDTIVDNLVTEEEHFFHEGSSMRKAGNTYYYVYADMERGKPTALGYSTSKFPMGPFIYQGIIIDNDGCDPMSWNNHGSIEQINGQWYVFYHRCSRGCQQYRRLCIEPITILPDGTIPEVKMTSQGIGEPFAPGEQIMGYQACEVHGSVYIDVDQQYGEKLTHISEGDEAVFRYVKSDLAYKEVEFQASGSGVIEILMNGTSAGKVRIENGTQLDTEIYMESGEYEVILRFTESKDLEIIQMILKTDA